MFADLLDDKVEETRDGDKEVEDLTVDLDWFTSRDLLELMICEISGGGGGGRNSSLNNAFPPLVLVTSGSDKLAKYSSSLDPNELESSTFSDSKRDCEAKDLPTAIEPLRFLGLV